MLYDSIKVRDMFRDLEKQLSKANILVKILEAMEEGEGSARLCVYTKSGECVIDLTKKSTIACLKTLIRDCTEQAKEIKNEVDYKLDTAICSFPL